MRESHDEKCVGSAFGLLLAMPIFAHHSSKAYDLDHSITLQGTITIAWTNPHVRINMDVKDASGNLTNWEVGLSSPNGLMSQGWKLDSLKAGDQVTGDRLSSKGQLEECRDCHESHLASVGDPSVGSLPTLTLGVQPPPVTSSFFLDHLHDQVYSERGPH